MIRFRLLCLGLIGAGVTVTALPAVFPVTTSAFADEKKDDNKDKLRVEVGKPLQEAAKLIGEKKYKEALAKIKDADAAKDKTALETLKIEQMRAAAAQGAGDLDIAVKSFEAVIGMGQLPAEEQLSLVRTVAADYYTQKDYPKTVQWVNRYYKEGGTDPILRTVLLQAYYLSNDFATAMKEALSQIQAAEHGGQKPAKELLDIYYSSAVQAKDEAAKTSGVEKLVTYYPTTDYWLNFVRAAQKKPTFSSRLDLDLDRFELGSGLLAAPSEYQPLPQLVSSYMDMAQLAAASALPAEAVKVLQVGFAAKILGAGDPKDIPRQKKLLDYVTAQAAQDEKTLDNSVKEAQNAKEGTALINTGLDYVAFGKFDKGIPLMEDGIRKGNLKRPEDDKLHLGYAYVQAGQKAKAIQMFQTVQGTDGTADIAKMWIIFLKQHP